MLYGTDIGNSGQGTITRIENLAERIPNYLEDARRELKETQKQLAVAQQQVGQPFLYEEELSEKVAQLTEINTKLEFESLQESEVILDENGQRSDGEEDWDSERVPACASAEVYLARDKNGQLRNWGQLTAAKWMKAYTEKGYACAVHVPHLNDFNTDLVEMRKGRSVEDLDRQRMAELETAFEQSAEEEPEQGMEV